MIPRRIIAFVVSALFICAVVLVIKKITSSEKFSTINDYSRPRGQILTGDGWGDTTDNGITCPRGRYYTRWSNSGSDGKHPLDGVYNCSLGPPDTNSEPLDSDQIVIRQVPVLKGNPNKWMTAITKVPFCNGNLTAKQNLDFQMEFTCE